MCSYKRVVVPFNLPSSSAMSSSPGLPGDGNKFFDEKFLMQREGAGQGAEGKGLGCGQVGVREQSGRGGREM